MKKYFVIIILILLVLFIFTNEMIKSKRNVLLAINETEWRYSSYGGEERDVCIRQNECTGCYKEYKNTPELLSFRVLLKPLSSGYFAAVAAVATATTLTGCSYTTTTATTKQFQKDATLD